MNVTAKGLGVGVSGSMVYGFRSSGLGISV